MPPMELTSLHHAVLRLLRPLIRMLIRRGVSYSEFADLARRVFVEVADEDFRLDQRKQSVSRISMLTGIQRKEVSHIRKHPVDEDTSLRQSYNRSARVISGWRRDSAFTDQSGHPLSLPFSGNVSFSELVRRYSGDIPARAVLDELARVGSVEQDDTQHIRLVGDGAHVVRGGDAAYQVLGMAAADLMGSIDHNLESTPEDSRLQLTVAYDNLSADAVRRFKQLSHEQSMSLLHRMDDWLAEQDRDSNPDAGSADDERHRAGIGIYFFEEPYEDDDS